MIHTVTTLGPKSPVQTRYIEKSLASHQGWDEWFVTDGLAVGSRLLTIHSD